MRVNISYSIDLDELVPRTIELLMKLSKELNKVDAQIQDVAYNFPIRDVMENIKVIDKNRQLLAMIDAQLSDYSAMLAGYQRTKADLYLAEQEKEKQLNGNVNEETRKLLEAMEAQQHHDETK